MDGYNLGVYKGYGTPSHQEARSPQEEGSREAPFRGVPFSKAEASFPEAPEGGAGGSIVMKEISSTHRIHPQGKVEDKVQSEPKDAVSGSASSVPRQFSFWQWCSGLVVSIARTRSPFAAAKLRDFDIATFPCADS